MGLGEGPQQKEQIAEVASQIAQLVPKLPKRVFVQTGEEGILELTVSPEQVYDGQAGYEYGDQKVARPPAVDAQNVNVDTVGGESRLKIRFVPKHTRVVHEDATPRRVAGNVPKEHEASLAVEDGKGKNLLNSSGKEATSDLTPEALGNIVLFLEKAIEQGKADQARIEAKINAQRGASGEALTKLL